MFKTVHGRLGVVLFCLVHGKGSTELVKKITGKLFCDSTLPNDEIGSDDSVEIHRPLPPIKPKMLYQDDDI